VDLRGVTRAAELADLAERESLLGRPTEAIWARFDELCPEPAGELLALRLMAAANHDDPEAASRDLERAAGLAEEAGNAVLAESARGSRLLRLALAGDRAAEAALEAVADRTAALGDAEAHSFALLRLATAHFTRQDFRTAQEVLDRAETPVRASGLPELAGLWSARRAVLCANLGELPRAIELAEESAARYTEAGSPERTAHSRLLGARFRRALGDVEGAFAATTGIDAGTDLGVRAQVDRFRGRLLARRLDRPEDAVAAFRSAIADFTAAGLPADAAATRVDAARVYLDLDRPENAAAAVKDAEPVLERAGAERELANGRLLLGRAYRALSRPAQAAALFGTVAAYFAGAEDPAATGDATEALADVLDELDRDAEAAAEYTRAAEYFEQAGLKAAELRVLRRAPRSWLRGGDAGQALKALATADATAAEADPADPDMAWERAMTTFDGALLLSNLDRPAAAHPRATAAAAELRAIDATPMIVVAEFLCGRLLCDLGKFAEAREKLTETLALLPDDADRRRGDVEKLLAELPS
jgi:tetratricopeptide (TPR) repeat protein